MPAACYLKRISCCVEEELFRSVALRRTSQVTHFFFTQKMVTKWLQTKEKRNFPTFMSNLVSQWSQVNTCTVCWCDSWSEQRLEIRIGSSLEEALVLRQQLKD